MPATLSVRIDPANPDHHLWLNHGSWWVHYVLYDGGRRRRVRFSLGTADVVEARAQRDAILARLGAPLPGRDRAA